VHVPDLAIVTCGEYIDSAKRAVSEAIQINLDAYREAGQQAPEEQDLSRHLANPEFRDLLFAYVEVAAPIAAESIRGRKSVGPVSSTSLSSFVRHWLSPTWAERVTGD
jgi:predicted RNase H-like HicB family nuclease